MPWGKDFSGRSERVEVVLGLPGSFFMASATRLGETLKKWEELLF